MGPIEGGIEIVGYIDGGELGYSDGDIDGPYVGVPYVGKFDGPVG